MAKLAVIAIVAFLACMSIVAGQDEVACDLENGGPLGCKECMAVLNPKMMMITVSKV